MSQDFWKKFSERGPIGLVLSGGGARGAYEAGALSHLANIGFEPDLIAGTSIGALNGSILAQEQEFSKGAKRLSDIWSSLGELPILKPDVTEIATQAALFLPVLSAGGRLLAPTLRRWVMAELARANLADEKGWFDPEPIENLIRTHVVPSKLREGRDIWVSVAKTVQLPNFPLRFIVDLVYAWSGNRADYIFLNECEDDDTLFSAILASAAIPLAFPSRKVGDTRYMDGGVVDNTPIQALLERKCSLIVVIHLSNGSVWNRHNYPGQTILEIRPKENVQRSEVPVLGQIESILDFRSDQIERLKNAGAVDAQAILEPMLTTIRMRREAEAAHEKLIESTQALLEDEPLLPK